MIRGVTSKEQDIIENILKDYPYSFYYYGSRVKGDYTKASDLDILLKADEKLPPAVLNELARKFNESKIPYIVNIAEYICMNERFYKLIEPDLIAVFN